MKHILLLEDDIVQINQLQKIIKNYSRDFHITCASNVTEARELLAETTNFGAFFLDISLSENTPNQDGLQFAANLSQIPHYARTPVLFITAFPEYVYSAVNKLHCYAYIIKPYDEKQIHRQLDGLFQKSQVFVLKTIQNVHVRLEYDTIQYIRSERRYLTYYTTNGNFISRQYTLQKLCEILPHNFVRCHKSYIINQTNVKNYDFANHYVRMNFDNLDIPLSRDFRV